MNLTHTDLEQIADLVADKILFKLDIPLGKWLTLEEAKQLLRRKSRNGIMRLIREGHFYAKQTGNKAGEWLIDRESIEAWLNSERF